MRASAKRFGPYCLSSSAPLLLCGMQEGLWVHELLGDITPTCVAPPPAQSWVLGVAGQDCNAACASQSLMCFEGDMRAITTLQKFTDAIGSAEQHLTCDQYAVSRDCEGAGLGPWDRRGMMHAPDINAHGCETAPLQLVAS